jgi:hypothetical protein
MWRSFRSSALIMSLLGLLSFLLSTTSTSPPIAFAQSPPTFTEVTDAAGLYHRNETWGWAWGDYDGDGYLDLMLGNHPEQGVPPQPEELSSYLMHNNGDGTFTDVIESSGIGLHADRHDQVWMDYDNDGDLDLWLPIGGRGGSGVEGPNQLYRQGPPGEFADVAVEAGVDYPLGRGRGNAWLDYDLDGDLDLYYTGGRQEEAPNALFRNNSDGTFTDVTSQHNLDAYVGPQSNVAVADYDQDGDPDMYVTGNHSRLYRNDSGTFNPAQSEAGVGASNASAADWGDYDNDGDLDLYITRGHTQDGDYEELTNSSLIRFVGRAESDADGLDFFVPEGSTVTFHLQRRAGGTVTQDPGIIYLGPDGHNPGTNPFNMDTTQISSPPPFNPGADDGFFIWQSAAGEFHIRWSGSAGSLIRMSGEITTDANFSGVSEIEFEPPSITPLANYLYQNQGDGTFVNVASTAGVTHNSDSRGADWGDFDNDGYLDLILQSHGSMDGSRRNTLYHNNGDGTFTDISAEAGVVGERDGAGWGVVFGDYDNDGFLDLLSSQATWPWPLPTGSYELYRNNGNANRWLQIDLQTALGNPDGYGAKLWITAGGMTQYREVADVSHYFNHYTGAIHLGVGPALQVDEVRVEWPSGSVDTFMDLALDQRITLVEGGGPAPTPAPTNTPGTPTATSSPTDTPTVEEIIIDNQDPEFSTVGFWNTNSNSSYPFYGADFRYSSSRDGSNQATFRPEILSAGEYEVSFWFLSSSRMSVDVPYTINHSSGSTTIRVDQNGSVGGGYWYTLGTFTFDAGTAGSIVISNDASDLVPADAVRLVPR